MKSYRQDAPHKLLYCQEMVPKKTLFERFE